MPTTKQIALAVETTPGVAATLDGDTVLDGVLSIEMTDNVELRDAEPATGTLSPSAQPVGQRTSEIQIELALKGSGTATDPPRFAPAILASGFRAVDVHTLAFTTASETNEQLEVGDLLTGNTSGATALVAATAKIGAATVVVVPLSGTWQTSEQVNSAQHGANIGTAHGTAVLSGSAVGIAYRPVTYAEVSCDATGSFSGGTPSAGDSVKFTTGSTLIGEGEFVSHASDVLSVRLFWGTITAGCVCTTTAGETITIDTPAGVVAAIGPQASARYLRGNRAKLLNHARANFEVNVDAGQSATFRATITGQPGTVGDGTRITPTNLPATTAPIFAKDATSLIGGANIAGARIPVRSVQVSAGATVTQVPDANSVNGSKGGEITARAATLSITVEQAGIAAVNLHALRDAGTTIPIGVEIGTTAGNRMSIICRAAQITQLADQDDNGTATYQVSTNLVTPGDGDDELFLVFS